MAYERLGEPVAPPHVFVWRIVGNLLLALGLIAGSLVGGMWGYHLLENRPWIDAFAEAAMILSGMGPLTPLLTTGGKIFAGLYAITCGLLIFGVAGLILAPVFHRVLHTFHVKDSDGQDGG